MHPVAQLRRCHCQHPAQLAATQDADGFAGRDHLWYHLRMHCLSLAAQQRLPTAPPGRP
jgi:hypothetical protein